MKKRQSCLKHFKVILQNPQLPTGCEITALAMVLGFYGFRADKVELAEKYLPRRPYHVYLGENGKACGPDLERYFIGNPAGRGYVCGTRAIVRAADRYLRDRGSSLRADDMTGISPEELYGLVKAGSPVLVWVTIGMKKRKKPMGWYTEEGSYVDWSRNDHGAALIGAAEKRVWIADPILGKKSYRKTDFEKVFEERGRRCVVISRK